jgi:hypothetical protein
VTGCVFTAESVTAKHPLLGDLTIRRDAIANLARAEPVPDAEADDEEEDKADEEEEDEDP